MAVAERSARGMPFPAGGEGVAGRGAALWALAALLVLGAGLRFATLGQQSFWIDEAATWNVVHGGFGHVISTIPRTESTPPLYYVLVWAWSRAFGIGEVGLRSFSALCGTLTIPVVWELGRRVLSTRAGLIAAGITAVNPLLIWFSQEARAYSLLVLLSALSLWALSRVIERPERGRLAVWGLICALALCTHYFAAFVVGPEGVVLVAWLWRQRRLNPWPVACALLPVAVMAGALAPLAVHQNDGRASYISYYSGSLGYRFLQLGKEDIIGYGQPAKLVLTALGACVVVLGLLWLARAPVAARRRSLGLVAIGAGGVLLALLVSAVATDYFNTRNLLGTWPALALVVAAGLGAQRRAWLSAGATAALMAISLYCVADVIAHRTLQRDDWRGAVQAAGPAVGARAIVSDSQSPVTLKPYLPGLSRYPAAGVALREVDLLWLRRRQWGRVTPIAPRGLAGFSASEVHAATFIVVRYRSATGAFVSRAQLAGLFPDGALATVLLQRP